MYTCERKQCLPYTQFVYLKQLKNKLIIKTFPNVFVFVFVAVLRNQGQTNLPIHCDPVLLERIQRCTRPSVDPRLAPPSLGFHSAEGLPRWIYSLRLTNHSCAHISNSWSIKQGNAVTYWYTMICWWSQAYGNHLQKPLVCFAYAYCL